MSLADLDWNDAVIPPEKLVHYLLNLEHPEGGPKAVFFRSCGFDPERSHLLDAALRAQANASVLSSVSGEYGVKYVADGMIIGVDGRERRILSVWIVETGQVDPRFVTAYPQEAPDADR